jgi:polar amino acid transport system substrate-binding protein
MKKSVKILSIVLALVIVIGCFAACGGKEEPKEEKKVLTMATNAEFPPYEYYEGDKVVGIDAEVAQLIADKLGMELKIEDVAFDSIIPGVQAGKYDMGMAGMTVTDERLESVDFSSSYATGIQAVIVKEDGKIQSLEDLDPFYLPAE